MRIFANSFIIFCILIQPVIVPATHAQQKRTEKVHPEYDWSGSAVYISRGSSAQADGHSHASRSTSSSTEYRMEATISRGYGQSSSSLSIESSERRSEWFTGQKTDGGYTVTGSASGSMDTEIIVEFSEDEDGKPTYSLFIPIPACSGKSTKTFIDGTVFTSEIGQDEGMIQIEYQLLGDNPNLISGEIRDSVIGSNGERSETILRWSFVKGPLDMELIISPENYDTWLPEPGRDESTPGSKINIGLKVQQKDGTAPKLKVKSFELSLLRTSAEPGITINYPLVISKAGQPDLQFTGEHAFNDGQEISIAPADNYSGTATIASFDGGGYTTLRAEAILEGGIRIQGRLHTGNGDTDIRIPKRDQEAIIASSWLEEKRIKNKGEQWDEESSPGNGNNGDGLSVYEEYRGVISMGRFRRLDPNTKELGIRMKREDMPELLIGLDLFTDASGIKTVPLYETELGENRIFNRNKSNMKKADQYALNLVIEPLPGDTVGENRPVVKSGKTPRQSLLTVVDIPKIRGFYALQKATLDSAGVPIPYTVLDEIANTIAHELAHGVFVTHHGPNSSVIPYVAYPAKDPPFVLYATDGIQMEIPGKGKRLYDGIGDKGNESSGDLSCIMAYTTRYTWHFEQAADRSLVYRMIPPLPQGKTFCTSGKGTGINAGGFFGDSKKGNCLGQLKVKDE